MANVKFSELPQVTTIAGTDIVPTVASSATSKITITDFANSFPEVSSSISSSYALSASNSATASLVISASYARSASWAPPGSTISASYAGTASYVNELSQSLVVIGSLSNGLGNTITGISSHAEGYFCQTLSGYSHAEGYGAYSIAPYSHAEGSSTRTYGTGSHAEGTNTQASGSYSHAEGIGAIPYGYASHAEGSFTQTLGQGSHAEGHFATASANYSHAEGYFTVAAGLYQHTQGQYNITSSAQSAFIIGNGVSDNNRSNLVFASGSEIQITGSIEIINGGLASDYIYPVNLGYNWRDAGVLVDKKPAFVHFYPSATNSGYASDGSYSYYFNDVNFGQKMQSGKAGVLKFSRDFSAVPDTKMYTIISDGLSVSDYNTNIFGYNAYNNQYHVLTVTGSLRSVDNTSLGTYSTNKHYITGSIYQTGSFIQNGFVILSQVSMSLNFADDTAAAAGGVPLGGLYRNGNFVVIRIS